MTRRAICFDATGTLIELSESVGTVYARVAKAFGVELPGWRIDDAFQRVLRQAPLPGGCLAVSEPQQRRQAEYDGWSERIRQTFQAADSTIRFANFPGFAHALFEAYRSPERWRLRAGVRETLADLARRDFEMVVVSNFDYRLIEILDGLELKRFFKHVYIPSETGARKPEFAAFRPVAEALGIPIADQIYVGDDPPDVLAAIAAHGLRVVDIHDLSGFEALTEELTSAAMVSADPPGSTSSR